MKEMVNIRYKTLIVSGEDKMNDLYEGLASHEWMMGKEVWSFKHQTFGQMKLVIIGDQLYLCHGLNELQLVLSKKQSIAYKTAYGTMMMEGLLKKLERNNNRLRIVYYLYDGQEIISQCYLTLDVINPNLS